MVLVMVSAAYWLSVGPVGALTVKKGIWIEEFRTVYSPVMWAYAETPLEPALDTYTEQFGWSLCCHAGFPCEHLLQTLGCLGCYV